MTGLPSGTGHGSRLYERKEHTCAGQEHDISGERHSPWVRFKKYTGSQSRPRPRRKSTVDHWFHFIILNQKQVEPCRPPNKPHLHFNAYKTSPVKHLVFSMKAGHVKGAGNSSACPLQRVKEGNNTKGYTMKMKTKRSIMIVSVGL
jgi:hypothetical protein